MYEERFYRDFMKPEGLVSFTVVEMESDLRISADRDLSKEAHDITKKYRNQLTDYIKKHHEFLKSFVPVKVQKDAPGIVKHMALAATIANVGPMASVAGAISQYVGNELLKYSHEVIVENGGDIFIKTNKERKISIYAGDSPLSNKIAIRIKPESTPQGICTSSGTVGHSISFGKADAVMITCKDTLISDAAASAVGNAVKTTMDIERGIEVGKRIKSVEGILIIIEDKLGIWGNIELIKV